MVAFHREDQLVDGTLKSHTEDCSKKWKTNL